MSRKIFCCTIGFLLSVNVAFAGSAQKSIQVKGSDTMVNLGQAWAEGIGRAHV